MLFASGNNISGPVYFGLCPVLALFRALNDWWAVAPSEPEFYMV